MHILASVLTNNYYYYYYTNCYSKKFTVYNLLKVIYWDTTMNEQYRIYALSEFKTLIL